MAETVHTTDDVYGIARDLPLNYVERTAVDRRLVENLTRSKHIVIYGSSKQGKTSLRKHCLNIDDYIMVQCSNKWSVADLHAAILKQAGYQVTQSTKRTVAGRHKLLASLGGSVLGIGAKSEAEVEKEKGTEITTMELELDPEDVNDVIAALNRIKFAKYIVLEDFHYLPTEAQKDFAVSLKAFHEASDLCFIVIGVWLEENRLIVYNGDLTGRVVAVDADRWTRAELQQVIDDGAALLNVRFANELSDRLLDRAFDSVYIVQEVCREACRRCSVFETQTYQKVINGMIDVPALIKEVVDQQSGRYLSFISQFADGFQETRLEMHRWLLYSILNQSIDSLEAGVTYAEIRRNLQATHPSGSDLNLGNLTQALQSCAALQVKKDIKPIILDYDQTNRRLNVVDRGFFIWIENQDRQKLLDTAGLSASK